MRVVTNKRVYAAIHYAHFLLLGMRQMYDLLHILRTRWQLYLLVIGGFIVSDGIAEEYGWRRFLLPYLLRVTG